MPIISRSVPNISRLVPDLSCACAKNIIVNNLYLVKSIIKKPSKIFPFVTPPAGHYKLETNRTYRSEEEAKSTNGRGAGEG